MKILIKGGRVIDPKSNFDDVVDIYIENGVIADMERDLELEGLGIE